MSLLKPDTHSADKRGEKTQLDSGETKDSLIKAGVKCAENRMEMERTESAQGELCTCKCLAAPHWSSEDVGATTDGAGLCVCVRDGGRGARRQSLGTEPGMPSLQAKQEHGEPLGERSLATTAAAATAMAECAAPSALLRNRTFGQRSFFFSSL